MHTSIRFSRFGVWRSFIFLLVLHAGVPVAEGEVPRNKEELKARLVELRAEYAPYLRSLPRPLCARERTPIDGPWRTRFEVEQADHGDRPAPPAWHGEDFDDSSWEATSVPEWRYKTEGYRTPVSCILWYRTQFPAKVVPASPPTTKGRRTFLVFGGVDWEAEVWLNGVRLGSHKIYYEPFRFDVTGLLKERNTLAVRVIDGPKFGEPRSYWSLLPMIPAERQRYVRDKARSIVGYKAGDLHLGSGMGIHREVYLETTGQVCIREVFARADLDKQRTKVTIETDAAQAARVAFEVQILPENFEGTSYRKLVTCEVPQGVGKQSISVPMPEARLWSPETPRLYRCRIVCRTDAAAGSPGSSVERPPADSKQDAPSSSPSGEPDPSTSDILDAKDVLFGYRSFDIVSKQRPRQGLPEGMFLLNGDPLYLRGTNIQGLNALWFWGESDRLLETILLLKAGRFNAVRFCQHVGYPEVREMLDRLGIMSEQDQGSGQPSDDLANQLPPTGTALARVCYNNPGVVLMSFGNETRFDPTRLIEAVLAVDPERILVPISGNRPATPAGYTIPEEYWANVIDDYHAYSAWYSGGGEIWTLARIQNPRRLRTAGEFGAEALDSHETMTSHYPPHWERTPPADADVLWGHAQVEKADARQYVGFRGRRPVNLGQYIEASQTYQADVMSEVTKGFRLSPRAIGGYFQFHFIDLVAANWPKSVVSHDGTPKKGYFALAQTNQPLVPLIEMVDRGNAMRLWLANDLPEPFVGGRLRYTVRNNGKTLVEGEQVADVPAVDAVVVGKVDLTSVPESAAVLMVLLTLDDSNGKTVAGFEQELFLRAWREQEALLASPQIDR
ncbi:MAG TPA: hypothetical protein DD670_09600 [Planctomycetaceae bacterium]|nr:hypothetical protein [Planctomycetaceae bacterium]